MDLKEKILEELSKCDKHPYQLYDALKLNNYNTLWEAIHELKAEGKIKSYFSQSSSIPTLTYALVEPTEPRYPIVIWGR